MSDWDPTTLVRVDREYDRRNADSRFGSYISARTEELFEEDRTDRALFTAWAWRIATPPVMSPGYIDIRPDLSVTFDRDEDGDPIVKVTMPLPHRALAREHRPGYEVGDWEAPYGRGETYPQLWAPAYIKRTAVLASAVMLVPATDWTLFVPSGRPEQLVDDAQLAVETAARLINEYVGPQVADLLGAS
ncbi:hypothetical protein GCM10010331_74780 [Streptomyces xanthochromogenes]|uniref:hypothetical protein n=1 Tax=Streptomyces xanthochromogenes TaxID=67384 RepID=UPI0016788144|nr:hypothetical protein [Streptomyces xanthochromogenes]GHB75954.1 hypothetical protein GCM10010331_74780 [Streptomyces xanthochromogenes]